MIRMQQLVILSCSIISRRISSSISKQITQPCGAHLPARIGICRESRDARLDRRQSWGLFLGWDTDHLRISMTAFAMLTLLKAGGFKNGGLNFD
jgi:hypothetical protein